jgi:hypothetical protein
MTLVHAYGCDGRAEAHVVWDWKAKRFQAEKRCVCRALSVVSRKRHAEFFPANDEAEGLPYPTTGVTRVRTPPPGRPPKTYVVPVVVPPAPIEVHNAWIAWWIGYTAERGYESRLRVR